MHGAYTIIFFEHSEQHYTCLTYVKTKVCNFDEEQAKIDAEIASEEKEDEIEIYIREAVIELTKSQVRIKYLTM